MMGTGALIFASVGAVACAAYSAVSVFVAHRFTTPKRVPAVLPPVHLTREFASVKFSSRDDGLQLAGWYGKSEARAGAVILVHGRNASRGGELVAHSFHLSKALMADGFSVLMVDLRGHGESANGRTTFGLHEQRDVLGAVDFLLAKGYPARTIGVLGASMGAVSAIHAAALEPAIGAVVADSPFFHFGQLLSARFKRLTRLPNFFLPGSILAARAFTGERLLRHSLHEATSRLAGRPMLVIHAARDPFVPVAHAHAVAERSGARVWITDSDRHLASFARDQDAYQITVRQFFSDNLRLDDQGPQSAPTQQPRARHPEAESADRPTTFYVSSSPVNELLSA